ncbi:hypothetical protein MP638_002636 [Amoeboaphelidium occidentale]|nr:hypothetical protein MP638_002636 [Amoeboaphelidium occidentale]
MDNDTESSYSQNQLITAIIVAVIATFFLLSFGYLLVPYVTGRGRYYTKANWISSRKYFVLFLACAILWGSSAGYDSPSTISVYLQSHLGMSFEAYQYLYSLFYSAYSIPNVILPMYSSSLIHRFGFHSTLVALTSVVFCGVFVYGIGVQARDGFTLVLGRFLLGVGAESLTVLQASLITKYFAVSDLSFALAVSLSFGRMFSVFNYNTYPSMAKEKGVEFASWIPSLVSSISVGSSIIAVLLDRTLLGVANDEVQLEQPKTGKSQTEDDGIHPAISPTTPELVEVRGNLRSRPTSRLMNGSDDDDVLFVNENSESDSLVIDTHLKEGSSKEKKTTTIFGILLDFVKRYILPADFYKLPYTFWMLTIVLIFYMTATINFLPLAPMFLKTKYFPVDPSDQSTSLVSLPDTFSVIAMPIIGLFSDRLAMFLSGKESDNPVIRQISMQIQKTRQCMFSGFALLVSHFLFAFTDLHPTIPLLFLGFGYAAYGSILYSLMADLVKFVEKKDLPPSRASSTEELESPSFTKQSATLKSKSDEDEGMVACAYGTSGCLTNISFTIVPLIVASILSTGNASGSSSEPTVSAYFYMELFFMFITLMGLLGSFELERTLQKMKSNIEASATASI